jgi:hypothetical protein
MCLIRLVNELVLHACDIPIEIFRLIKSTYFYIVNNSSVNCFDLYYAGKLKKSGELVMTFP